MDIRPYTGEDLAEIYSEDEYFFLATKYNFYFNRPTAWGTALVQMTPPDLAGWPYNQTTFYHNGMKLPAELIAEVVDWFRRIYRRDHSEAEVLLTYNPKADPPLRAFIPPQRCTGASVSSAFDPGHLARGWQLVGSIHSHCMMGAFHSGTDTADASEFDGLHITVGHVLDENPEFAVMFMVNNKRWDYKIESITDLSLIGQREAPTWWDRYIIRGDVNAKIDATYQEFKPPPRTPLKPVSAKPVTQRTHTQYNPWRSDAPTIWETSSTDSRRYSDDDDAIRWRQAWDEWEDEYYGALHSRPQPNVYQLPSGSNDPDKAITASVNDVYRAITTLQRYGVQLADFLDDEDIYGSAVVGIDTSSPTEMLNRIDAKLEQTQ